LAHAQADHKPGVLGYFYEYGKLGEFCATSEKVFKKQSTFSSIKYLHNITRSYPSNEISLVNFRDSQSQCIRDLLCCWSWCDIWRSLLHLHFVATAYGKV